MNCRRLWLLVVAGLLFVHRPTPAREPETPGGVDHEARKTALGEFNSLIGKWRGVGQPRRGSNQGAWQEQAEWAWNFQGGEPSVQVKVNDGKLADSLQLTYDSVAKDYVGTLMTPEGQIEKNYRGRLEKDGKLVLSATVGDEVKQITITRLNEKRTLVLFEKRSSSQASFNRVAEVGYTREGTRLATSSTSGPECIVTGGAGTIEVKYKGQTYYVCCSGCRQAFDDDPEGVIAEAAVRRKREMDKAR